MREKKIVMENGDGEEKKDGIQRREMGLNGTNGTNTEDKAIREQGTRNKDKGKGMYITGQSLRKAKRENACPTKALLLFSLCTFFYDRPSPSLPSLAFFCP